MRRITQALVAEDNPGDMFLLREVFRDFAPWLQIIWVEDGAEGMAWLEERLADPRQSMPDVAILDLNLPKYSGLDLLERIRRERLLAMLPVVIMSSSDNARDREAAQRMGADAYFHKPSDFGAYLELRQLLRELMGWGAAAAEGNEQVASDVQYPVRRFVNDHTVIPLGSVAVGAANGYKQEPIDGLAISGPARGYVPRRQNNGARAFRRRRKFAGTKADAAPVGGAVAV